MTIKLTQSGVFFGNCTNCNMLSTQLIRKEVFLHLIYFYLNNYFEGSWRTRFRNLRLCFSHFLVDIYRNLLN